MTRIKWDTELARKTVKDMWGDAIELVEPFSYTNIDTKVEFICKTHGAFTRSIYAVIHRKYPCPKCSPTGPKGWDFIKEGLYKKHGNRYDYSLMDNGGYTSHKPLKIICSEHGVFSQRLGEHQKGSNCPRCVEKEKRKTINNFLYESIEKHGNLYSYENIFTHFDTYNDKLPIICKKHGEFWQRAGDHSRGTGCPSCNQSSKGESRIKKYLLDNRIVFETEKSFSDFTTAKGYKYRFDFYLPEHNVLIEYDGVQHHTATYYNDYNVDNQLSIDKIKNEYAASKELTLIRISVLDKIDDYLGCLINKEVT
jgi:hypothetical protein